MRRLFVVVAILLWASFARAGDYENAKQLDAEFRFADALAAYERAADPHSGKGAEAAARAEVLRAHAEADFQPFVALERARRNPTPAGIEALVSAADGFPAGRVRIEAWVLGADDRIARGNETSAEPLLRKILSDPLADPVLVRKARRDLVMALAHRNAFADAAAIAGEDRPLVARLARRRYVHLASIAIVLAMPFFVLVAIARRRAGVVKSLRKIAPLVLLYAAWTAIAGGLMAASYESGTSLPFVVFAIASVLILALARAWGAAGSPARPARIARASLAALTALAAGFLVLERIDLAYLDSLGL